MHHTHSLRREGDIDCDDLDKKLEIIKDHFLPIAKDWEKEEKELKKEKERKRKKIK